MSNAQFGKSFVGSTLFGGDAEPVLASHGIDAFIGDRSQNSTSPGRSADAVHSGASSEVSISGRGKNLSYPDRTIGG